MIGEITKTNSFIAGNTGGKARTMEIIEQMQKIAEKYIKHYMSDFTNYDVPAMHRIMQESEQKNPLIWIVRPCGSWLLETLDSASSMSVYRYYLDDKTVRYYEIDLRKNKLTLLKDRQKYMKKGA